LNIARYNLEIREQKLLDVEPFLPMARTLRDMSLGFDEIVGSKMFRMKLDDKLITGH
jgi:hypothetical protein